MRRPGKAAQVDVHGIAQRRARLANHHLPGVHQNGISQTAGPIKSRRPLQDQKFVRTTVKLAHTGGAGDLGGNSRHLEPRSFGRLRGLKQNCAFDEIQLVSSVLKTEDAVLTEAGDRLIGKAKLGPRVGARADGNVRGDGLMKPRRSRKRAQGELHVLHDLRELRLGRGCGAGSARTKKQTWAEGEQGQKEEPMILIFVHEKDTLTEATLLPGQALSAKPPRTVPETIETYDSSSRS